MALKGKPTPPYMNHSRNLLEHITNLSKITILKDAPTS
jgi:hypothetical protein